MPGAHKIGAAISGPRITGGNYMDTTLSSDSKRLLNKLASKNPSKNLLFTENPYRRLLRNLLRSTSC